MKKLFTLALAATVALFAFGSCDLVDDLKDKANITVSLGEQEFAFPISIADLTRAESTGNFGGSFTLDLDHKMFSELKDYLNDNITIEVSNLKMTIVPASGITDMEISSFNASADGISPSYATTDVPVGTEFTDSKLASFLNAAILKVVKNNEITINVSGNSNITEPGQIGEVKIKANFKAKVALLK